MHFISNWRLCRCDGWAYWGREESPWWFEREAADPCCGISSPRPRSRCAGTKLEFQDWWSWAGAARRRAQWRSPEDGVRPQWCYPGPTQLARKHSSKKSDSKLITHSFHLLYTAQMSHQQLHLLTFICLFHCLLRFCLGSCKSGTILIGLLDCTLSKSCELLNKSRQQVDWADLTPRIAFNQNCNLSTRIHVFIGLIHVVLFKSNVFEYFFPGAERRGAAGRVAQRSRAQPPGSAVRCQRRCWWVPRRPQTATKGCRRMPGNWRAREGCQTVGETRY